MWVLHGQPESLELQSNVCNCHVNSLCGIYTGACQELMQNSPISPVGLTQVPATRIIQTGQKHMCE